MVLRRTAERQTRILWEASCRRLRCIIQSLDGSALRVSSHRKLAEVLLRESRVQSLPHVRDPIRRRRRMNGMYTESLFEHDGAHCAMGQLANNTL